MSDLDKILSDEPLEEVTEDPAPEEPTGEAETLTPEEPQAEEAEETPAEQEPEAEAPKVEEPPQTMVPLAALQSEREEVKALRERLAAMQQPQQPAPQPAQMPDFVDPEAAQWMQTQLAQRDAHYAAHMSEMKARLKYGDDAVDEAFAAAQTAGALDRFKVQQDPWGSLAQWHKQEKVRLEIGDDVDAYKAKLKAEVAAEIKAELVAEQARKVASPASLATDPNLGSRTKAPAWSGPMPLDSILGG